jgi:hypothetical protein
VVAELIVVGVPLMVQFVVLNVRPVLVCRLGDILQELTVPVTVTVLDVIAIFCVKVKGEPE